MLVFFHSKLLEKNGPVIVVKTFTDNSLQLLIISNYEQALCCYVRVHIIFLWICHRIYIAEYFAKTEEYLVQRNNGICVVT